jgi:hypothetical protein
MRIAKEEELKREIEVIAQSHERGTKRGNGWSGEISEGGGRKYVLSWCWFL